MNQVETARYELRAEMFKALAHPMRLLLLDKLKEGPRCVCELAAAVGIEKSIASKHLSQLRRSGIIEDERRGTSVEYRLVAPCILEMALCAESTIILNQRRRLALAEAKIGEEAVAD